MTMAIVFTVVAILALTFIGALAGAAEGDAVDTAIVFFFGSARVAFVCWVIYIFIHFAIKYW